MVQWFHLIEAFLAACRRIGWYSHVETDVRLVVGQYDPVRMQDTFTQRRARGMHCYFLIIYAEFSNINRRYEIALLVIVRIEGDQSVDRPEVEFPVASLHSRIVVELVADQSVLYGKYTDITGLRFKFHQPLVGTEPEIVIFIFQYFISYIIR